MVTLALQVAPDIVVAATSPYSLLVMKMDSCGLGCGAGVGRGLGVGTGGVGLGLARAVGL